ncbi:rhomboid family intramembrane serine protease [Rhizobium sp. BR 362]|uniref:rhomboid family intramembrane serine protease n=1 Tax=Rhizobium sp. BR 362 TaxID=3040670 RepID=UPI002F425DD0
MDVKVPQKIEFAYDKGRTLWLSFLVTVIAAAVAGGPFLPDRPGHPHLNAAVCWPFAFLIVLLAASLLLKIFKGKPGLIISQAGIHMESYFDETIPWRAVRGVRRYHRRNVDLMNVDLDPMVARTLSRRGLMGWMPRPLRGREDTAAVSLKLLHGDPDWIYDQCLEFLAKDREQTLTTGGLILADQNEVSADPVFNLKGHPIFSYVLIAILIAIYIGELNFGVVPAKDYTPSTQTLLVLGGIFRERILSYGEWWRLVTAAMLHGSVIHLTFNCLALWRAGILLERLIGWRWFAAIFCISALGGSVGSLLMNPANMVGVGASGGIIGLFAAVIVASFHFPSGPLPQLLRIGAIQILVPSLLPIVGHTADGVHIDYAAHLGGAVAGVAVSLVLLKAWPNTQIHPRFGVAALIGGIAFAAVAAGSIWRIGELRVSYLANPFVQYFQGQYQKAGEDFAEKAKLDEHAAPYYYLWRFIAQSRGNDDRAEADLRTAASNLDQAKWPYPVYELFLGQLTPSEVSAKATTGDSLCEAMFYIGEWHNLRKETDDAREKFSAALSLCPTTFMEYDGAGGELLRLHAR